MPRHQDVKDGIIQLRSAEVELGKRFPLACVRTPSAKRSGNGSLESERFGTTTGELRRLLSWLVDRQAEVAGDGLLRTAAGHPRITGSDPTPHRTRPGGGAREGTRGHRNMIDYSPEHTTIEILRAQAEKAEAADRPAPESLHALREDGIFALRTPKDHGGTWADTESMARCFTELGRACPPWPGSLGHA
jgi:hypothetical protein